MEKKFNKFNEILFSIYEQEKSISYLKYIKLKKYDKRTNEKIITIRNYGFDLLRIFSMINIFNLHINLGSGLLSLHPKSQKYKAIWRLETFSYFGVNCFGLMSGVVGYKRYKFSNLIYLWLLVFFYSFLNSIILLIKNQICISNFILSFLPILNIKQWYFNAYFSMYLFLPFLNIGINNLNRKVYKNIVFSLIGFFSFYNIIAVLFNKKNYNFLINGYSTLWLIILYIIGGYLGKYIIKGKINSDMKYFFIFIFIYLGSSFFSSEFSFLLINTKNKKYKNLFINYLSPTILFQALSLIMIFSRLKINNKFIINIISFLSPLTFSTLIIHCVLFNRNFYIMASFFKFVKSINYNIIFFKIYGLSIFAYFFCIFIDYFRLLLFRIMKIRELIQFIERRFKV